MSLSLSLAHLIEVVGPSILSFLPEKEILCSLQFASQDICRSCSATCQLWRELVDRYLLGPALLQRAGENLPTVHLIAEQKSHLMPLDLIPNEVVYSMVSGIPRGKYVEDLEQLNFWLENKQYLEWYESDEMLFEQAKDCDWQNHTVVHLQLHWSGRWGVFCRLMFEKTEVKVTDMLQVVIELKASSRRNPSAGVIRSGRELDQDLMRQLHRSYSTDLMFGTIDARNISYDQEFQHCRQGFERLSDPIDIEVHFINFPPPDFNREEDSWYRQGWDVAYLWPLEDQDDRLTCSEKLVLRNTKDSKTTVQLQINRDMVTHPSTDQ